MAPLQPIDQESKAPCELSDPECALDSQNPPKNEASIPRARAPSKREIMEELSRARFPWEE
jgi:hypothetical protein